MIKTNDKNSPCFDLPEVIFKDELKIIMVFFLKQFLTVTNMFMLITCTF